MLLLKGLLLRASPIGETNRDLHQLRGERPPETTADRQMVADGRAKSPTAGALRQMGQVEPIALSSREVPGLCGRYDFSNRLRRPRCHGPIASIVAGVGSTVGRSDSSQLPNFTNVWPDSDLWCPPSWLSVRRDPSGYVITRCEVPSSGAFRGVCSAGPQRTYDCRRAMHTIMQCVAVGDGHSGDVVGQIFRRSHSD